MLWGGGEDIASIVADVEPMERPMQNLNDLSRPAVLSNWRSNDSRGASSEGARRLRGVQISGK
jgi:hypothetical protein